MGGAGTCVVTSLVQRVMTVRVIRILAPGVHAVILAWAWDAGCIRFSNREEALTWICVVELQMVVNTTSV
jgi:hypothetical protein